MPTNHSSIRAKTGSVRSSINGCTVKFIGNETKARLELLGQALLNERERGEFVLDHCRRNLSSDACDDDTRAAGDGRNESESEQRLPRKQIVKTVQLREKGACLHGDERVGSHA